MGNQAREIILDLYKRTNKELEICVPTLAKEMQITKKCWK